MRSHPNKANFRGVLTLVDVCSDKSPTGARGHRVILTKSAVEAALPSLLGMGVDYAPSLNRHDAQRKIGIITAAELRGQEVTIAGYLFAGDFPEVIARIDAQADEPLGLSYEITNVRVANIRAEVWCLTDVTFSGAAVLKRKHAAYKQTSIELIA